MTGAQAAGAGTGAVLGGVLSEALQHYAGYTIDPVSATAIVVSSIAAFGVIFHGVDKYGLRGIGIRVWRGAPTTAASATTTTPPAAAVASPPQQEGDPAAVAPTVKA